MKQILMLKISELKNQGFSTSERKSYSPSITSSIQDSEVPPIDDQSRNPPLDIKKSLLDKRDYSKLDIKEEQTTESSSEF